jgi:hypothetical protein
MDENSIKIIVCGDSYCASGNSTIEDVSDRAHFSQILEDRYGYTVINFAHGAMSNVGIWFQIREAINLSPHVIVYNQTWSARVEIMMNRQNFTIEKGLKNFIYSNPNQASTGTKYVGNVKNGNVLSTVWQGLKDNPFVDLSDEQILAVNLYIKHLYNDKLQTEIDTWMFEYWRDQIIKHKIIPIRFNDAHVGEIAYKFGDSYGLFHTDHATQEVIAKNIHQLLITDPLCG